MECLHFTVFLERFFKVSNFISDSVCVCVGGYIFYIYVILYRIETFSALIKILAHQASSILTMSELHNFQI